MKYRSMVRHRSGKASLSVATAIVAAMALAGLPASRVAIAAEDAGSPPKTASSIVVSPSTTATSVATAQSATVPGSMGTQPKPGSGKSATQPKPEPDQSGSRPKTAASDDDFTGDKLVLKSNMYNLTRYHDNEEGRIAMRGTIMRVTRTLVDSNGKDELLAVVESVPCVKEEDGKVQNVWYHVGVGRLVSCPKDSNDIDKMVKIDDVYKVSKEVLEDYGYYRSGWVYGGLLVPYKYYFHDKSFASAATIGPYLGYRMGGLGFDTALVVSLGLSSLAVANPNGNGDTSTIQGFSAAAGLIGGVSKNKNPLRFGIIVGRDWAGSNSAVPYKHEGKTWAAVQIGFSFSE